MAVDPQQLAREQLEQIRRQLELIRDRLATLMRILAADPSGLLASTLQGTGRLFQQAAAMPQMLAGNMLSALGQTIREARAGIMQMAAGAAGAAMTATPFARARIIQQRMAAVLPQVYRAAADVLPRFQTGRRYGAGAFTLSSQLRKWKAMGIPVPGLSMIAASEEAGRAFFRGIRRGAPAGAAVIPGGMAMASAIRGRPIGYDLETIMQARAAGVDIAPLLASIRQVSYGAPMPAFAGAIMGGMAAELSPEGAALGGMAGLPMGGPPVVFKGTPGRTNFVGGLGQLPIF